VALQEKLKQELAALKTDAVAFDGGKPLADCPF